MNRLTKKIGLVLISSSLILHGCERSLTEEEKKKQEEEQAAAAPAGTGTGGSHGYHPHVVPFFYGSRYRSGATGTRPGTTGIGTGTSHFSGASTGSGGRSGANVSTRGGFGATAHGVSS